MTGTSSWSESRLINLATYHHRSSPDCRERTQLVAIQPGKLETHLGMILLDSSASAGHKFAICAVSNCVSAGSLLRILNSILDFHCAWSSVYKEDELSNSTGGIGRVEFGKRFDIFQSLVIHTALTAKHHEPNQLEYRKTGQCHTRSIRCIFIPVL